MANAVEEEIGDVFPFQYPAAETHPFYTPRNNRAPREAGCNHRKYEHPNYTRLLNWCLKNEVDPAVGDVSLVLKPLIPLLYLSIFRIRDFCKGVREVYDDLQRSAGLDWGEATSDRIISDLPRNRLRLRAMVEESEDGLSHFLRYIRSQKSADWLLNGSWLKVEEDLKTTHQEAGRLEAQLRDYLQLQVGELALQESEKSIELSTRQIEEGKRG